MMHFLNYLSINDRQPWFAITNLYYDKKNVYINVYSYTMVEMPDEYHSIF